MNLNYKMWFVVSAENLLHVNVEEEHVVAKNLHRILFKLPNNAILINFRGKDYTLPYKFYNVLKLMVQYGYANFNNGLTIQKLLNQDEQEYQLMYDRVKNRYYYREPIPLTVDPITKFDSFEGAAVFENQLYLSYSFAGTVCRIKRL